MLTFAPYKFKLFLKHKAFEYGKTVIDVSEANTSKTHPYTGEIRNIGGEKNKTTRWKLSRQRFCRCFQYYVESFGK